MFGFYIDYFIHYMFLFLNYFLSFLGSAIPYFIKKLLSTTSKLNQLHGRLPLAIN